MFLKALAGTLLLAALPTAWWWRGRVKLPPSVTLKSLSAGAAFTLLALYRVLVTPADRERLHGGEAAFLTQADEVLGLNPPHLRKDLHLALTVLRLWPLTRLAFTPFDGLSSEKARQVFDDLHGQSKDLLHLAAEGPRQLVYFIYYGNDGVWRAMDYPGPMVGASP